MPGVRGRTGVANHTPTGGGLVPQTMVLPAADRGPFGAGEGSGAIDMANLLDQPLEPTRRVRISQIEAPPETGERLLTQTDMEGLRAIPSTRQVHSLQRRLALRRAAPLLLMTTLLTLGFALAALLQRQIAASAIGGDEVVEESALDARVSLPGTVALIGLSEDNTTVVIQACWRYSDNYNTECRERHLTELGELPAREVRFAELAVDSYEVSNGRYEACVSSGECQARDLESCQFHTHRGWQINSQVPERMLRPEYPAMCVTRSEAETFCDVQGGRLPTPDEWEWIARSGDDRLLPWGDVWAPSLMNWAEHDMVAYPIVGRLDGFELTAPADHFASGVTPDGVANLFGNVAEWVVDDTRRESGTRGGSYRDDVRVFRLTFQQATRPDARRSDVGFRCVYGDGAGAD